MIVYKIIGSMGTLKSRFGISTSIDVYMYIDMCACIHTHAFSCKQVGAAREALGERSGVHQMGCPEAPEILHNQEEGGNVGRWFVLRVPRHAHLLRHPNELS